MLDRIQSGIKIKPPRILIYGEPKVGKSTFAAGAEKPLFLDIERGADALDVAKLGIDSYGDFMVALDELATKPHDYKTLVIDSVDWLEGLIHRKICDDYKAASITDKRNDATSYGQGYIKAADMFKLVLRALDKVRLKGVVIIMIGHSVVKRIDPPDAEAYDVFTIKLHDKAFAVISEWCDVIGFAREIVLQDASGKASAGRRILQLNGAKYAQVGTRTGMPPVVDLDYKIFMAEYRKTLRKEQTNG